MIVVAVLEQSKHKYTSERWDMESSMRITGAFKGRVEKRKKERKKRDSSSYKQGKIGRKSR